MQEAEMAKRNAITDKLGGFFKKKMTKGNTLGVNALSKMMPVK